MFAMVGDDWLGDFKHIFLIRPPRETIDSYSQAVNALTKKSDGGVGQPLSTSPLTMQRVGVESLFNLYTRLKQEMPQDVHVLDSNELTVFPESGMRLLSEIVGVEYS